MGSLFPGPAHARCPDLVPGDQGQPPCPTTKLEWKVHSKDPCQEQGGTPPESWGDCLREGLDLPAPRINSER